MSRRVVVTGLGIVSCLGNSAEEVTRSLLEGKSGISTRQEHIDMGMRSHIAGSPDIDTAALIDRKQLRFMGDAAAYAYISMAQAIADAGLDDSQVSNVRTGIIAGSGGASSASQTEAADILRDRGLRDRAPDEAKQRIAVTGVQLLERSRVSRAEGRHQVFDRGDWLAFFYDRRRQRGVTNEISEGRNLYNRL